MFRTIFALLVIGVSSTLAAQDSTKVKSEVALAITDLREFVAIPNDALNPDDIDNNLFWLKKQFDKRGFNSAILDTEGLPLFFCQHPNQRW